MPHILCMGWGCMQRRGAFSFSMQKWGIPFFSRRVLAQGLCLLCGKLGVLGVIKQAGIAVQCIAVCPGALQCAQHIGKVVAALPLLRFGAGAVARADAPCA